MGVIDSSGVAIRVKGTITNDNAPAGFVGEFISATVIPGSAVALTTAVTANITSISLTAGDWNVTGSIGFVPAATTSITDMSGGTSNTSATLGAQGTSFNFSQPAEVPTAAFNFTFDVPVFRFSLAVTTTIFLVAQATFTVAALSAFGLIAARRIR